MADDEPFEAADPSILENGDLAEFDRLKQTYRRRWQERLGQGDGKACAK